MIATFSSPSWGLPSSHADVESVIQDMAGCPLCLTAVLLGMTGAAAEHMPHKEVHSIMAADLLMGAVMDESEIENLG
jgi:hypothetical protein